MEENKVATVLSGAWSGFWTVFKMAIRGNIRSFSHAAIVGYEAGRKLRHD